MTPPRRAALVSDVHLSPSEPGVAAAFACFLEGLSELSLDALYVLGDLFESWAGDEELDEPLGGDTAAHLSRLAQRGTALYFVTGNRDLLLGSRFAAVTGGSFLDDPVQLIWHGHRVVLSHGDALCSDDVDYQRYRAQVRSPEWQTEFLARPLAERRAVIAELRGASESAKARKSMEIMDVNPDAVRDLFRQTRADWLIHGHTHRPGAYRLMVEGRPVVRYVLPDWSDSGSDVRGGGLLLDSGGPRWLDRAGRLAAGV